jgi:8-oxo-dGTP diphosphatase
MKVVVGLIWDEQGRVLLTQRSFKTSHGGFWEFPGGKIEQAELPAVALVRELQEELGITVTEHQYLGEIEHQYPQNTIEFFIYDIKTYLNTPYCKENQLAMHWAKPEELANLAFPEANYKIIDLYIPCTNAI